MKAFKSVLAAAFLTASLGTSLGAANAEDANFVTQLRETFRNAHTPEHASPDTKYVVGRTLDNKPCALFFSSFAGNTYMMLGENFSYDFRPGGGSSLVGSGEKAVSLDYYGPKDIESPNFIYRHKESSASGMLSFDLYKQQTNPRVTIHRDGTQVEDMHTSEFDRSIRIYLEPSGEAYKGEVRDNLNKTSHTCYFKPAIS